MASPVVGPELVIALVRPIGVPRESLLEPIEASLNRLGYGYHVIRISSLLEENETPTQAAEDSRVEHLIEEARTYCEDSGDPSALAKLAIQEVKRLREVHGTAEDSNTDKSDVPLKRTAYIIDSLKRPAEITTLRRVYADRFYVIGGFVDEATRIRIFADQLRSDHRSEKDSALLRRAEQLVVKDDNETGKFGQNVRKTFPMSDFMVKIDPKNGHINRGSHSLEIARFFDLLFQSPRYSPPTTQELAMHLAETASSMTTALGRKVGACLVSSQGRVIALGHNEVPHGVRTDTEIGFDTSDGEIHQLSLEVLKDLAHKGVLSDESIEMLSANASGLIDKIGELPLRSLIEFQRPVHAEMTAIMDAARQGISLEGASIYTTTYPCHLCAKHIVALGLDPVIYIEPYPKSKAESMYEIAVKSTFKPFTGVTPRAFGRLFATPDSDRKVASGRLADWDPKIATPRLQNDFEGFAVNDAEAAALAIE